MESELISEFWGIMIFPSRLFQSKEKRLELAEERLKYMIREATALAISSGVKLENYDSTYRLSSLPFRMKPAIGQCQSIISTGMNAPGIRTTWTPSPLHRGCDIVIKFLNPSDKVINIETQQFTLITDKKIHAPKKEIRLFQRNISGNATSTNNGTQPVLQSFNLQPNTAGTERIELFFEYPMDEKPFLVRWQDFNQSSAVVEVTVPK